MKSGMIGNSNVIDHGPNWWINMQAGWAAYVVTQEDHPALYDGGCQVQDAHQSLRIHMLWARQQPHCF